ncbi:PREDICTED: protein FAM90A1 [Dipodomys ordii]|uniref:Protein FAM90A1 n=1 Tax=Dipodomys ordii TaxID=10020 RepID=A0A1S3FCI8_DIPOR|nr:PREDICTED: protein FAM90A1 [Dipodomys ordii]
MKQQQRDPVQLRVPPPEEENPWVKCQNCGAFGHSSRSKRCPIKSDHGSMMLMPLGLKKEKMKENQKPLNLQRPQLLDQAKRYKEQTRWLAEQQGKAVLQAVSRRHQEEEKHNWPEVTAPCAYLRQPTRPTLYHGNRKRSIPHPVQESQSPVKKDDRSPTCPPVPPIHGPTLARARVCSQGHSPGQKDKLSEQGTVGQVVGQATTKMHSMGQVVSQLRPAKPPEEKQLYLPKIACREGHQSKIPFQAPGKRAITVPRQTGQNPPKKPRFSPSPRPGCNTEGQELPHLQALTLPLTTSTLDLQASPQANKQTAMQGPSFQLQPTHSFPPLQPAQPHTDTQHCGVSPCPGQPLKMVFTRLHHDMWASSFLPLPSPHSTEKISPSASKLLLLDNTEGHSSGVPHSVLHENLRLSSL